MLSEDARAPDLIMNWIVWSPTCPKRWCHLSDSFCGPLRFWFAMLTTDSPRCAAAEDTADLRKQVLVGRLFLGLMWMSIVCPFWVIVQAVAAEMLLLGWVFENAAVESSLYCNFGM